VERKMEKGAVERRGQWATEGDHLTHNINKGVCVVWTKKSN